MNTITLTTKATFTTVPCCNCGIVFAVADEYDDARRNDHRTFYCPNGHSLSYGGKSEAEKEAARLRAQLDQMQAARDDEARQRLAAEARERKANTARKRAEKGVCPVPGCKRSFVNVARHVASQHPDHVHE